MQLSLEDVTVRAGDSIVYSDNPIIDTINTNFIGSWVVDCDVTASYLHLSFASSWGWFYIYGYQVYSEQTLNAFVNEVSQSSGTWSNDPMSTVRNDDHFGSSSWVRTEYQGGDPYYYGEDLFYGYDGMFDAYASRLTGWAGSAEAAWKLDSVY